MKQQQQRSQKDIDKAVERYTNGEDVNSLARQYGVSRAGFYLWVRKAKDAAAQKARVAEIGEKGVETETRINLNLAYKALKDENDQLRKKLFELMIRHKEL